MSWQLSSYAIVVASLASCFWWYERSRPSAKLVALVATLAALAALGRDAFAAVPDVKPITAIVLVSGVAFGAGPGFAVGAIGGLASNLLLGQGPWTPWQMMGWGVVGVLGAGLGAITGRRIGRLPLALACAVGAEVFNLIVDFYTWTGTGAHTLASYGVIVSAALTFDVTHVVASFAFGFAFGPALLRMLVRVRSRLEVSWAPLGQTLAPVLVAALALGSPAGGVPAARAAAAVGSLQARAVAYLRAAQNADGGFGGAPRQASSELYSAWAAMGLAGAGVDVGQVRRDGHTVVNALAAQAGQLQGAGDLERTILALRAAGAPVNSLAGRHPLTQLLAMRSPDGSFGDEVNTTAFAIFALRAAGMAPGSPQVKAAGRWLVTQQNHDGGFGFLRRGVADDIDDTAGAVQAVVDSLGRADPTVGRSIAYLLAQQDSDGGFPLTPGAGSDAQSTAWAVQALVAAGRDPARVHRHAGRSPLAYLDGLVAANGSVRYSSSSSQSPVWVTAQALTALAGKPFPIGPARG